jgi:TonB family protein
MINMRPRHLARIIPAFVLAIASICLAIDHPERAALVQHATEMSNIRSTDVGPFRLHARVHVFEEPPTDADYLLTWASPDRWREEISVGSHHTVRIGGKNTVSTEDDSEQAHHLAMRSLDVAALLYVKPGESLGGIKSQNQDGAKIQCLSRAEKHTADTELCFDAATGVLARVRYQLLLLPDSITEFSGYSEFRGKLIPRVVRALDGKYLHQQIEVLELTYDPSPDPSLFEIGPQFKTSPGCEHPVGSTVIKMHSPDSAQLRTRNNQTVKLSATVNETGGVQDIAVIHSAGAQDAYAIKALEKWKFAPATCGGVGVPSQFYVEMNF